LGGGVTGGRLEGTLGAGGAGASATPLGISPGESPVAVDDESADVSLKSGIDATMGGSGKRSGAAATGAAWGGGGVNAAGGWWLNQHPLENNAHASTNAVESGGIAAAVPDFAPTGFARRATESSTELEGWDDLRSPRNGR